MQTLTPSSVESLLLQRFQNDSIKTLSDLPLPQTLENLFAIAKRIKEAIQLKKRIVIVGDYDVDGVVSCAILQSFFEKISYPVSVEIPHRFNDGYGLSKSVIARLECDVVITVDNGINAIEAAEICKQRGIELLITDHHTPQDVLPDALICNPKLSKDFLEPEICGACVAWYLCAAMKAELELQISLIEFLDYLALAIVSDVMPLRGLNRVLLKKGLEVLSVSQRVAFVRLREYFAKHSIDAQLISYYIAPLLNCAGRMDSAMLAFRFLVEKDVQKSKKILEQLVDLNTQRKNLQNTIYEEAKKNFCAQENYQNLPFILVYQSHWHEGIIGIIAARLCEEFLKPCIILTQKDSILKGSMRSIDVDCMDVLEGLKEYLEAFGGHFGAAGLSLKIEHLESFKNALLEFKVKKVAQNLNALDVLGRLPLGFIDKNLFAIIQKFAPFGHGNVMPKFYTQAMVTNVRNFGAGHSSICLREGEHKRIALAFFKNLEECRGKMIECVYTLQWDKYKEDVVLHLEYFSSVA